MKYVTKFLSLVSILALAWFLQGCASNQYNPEQIKKIKTIGVINSFPEFPSYITLGTTNLNHDGSVMKLPELKGEVSHAALTYLQSKGYQAQLTDLSNQSGFDMIIHLRPSKDRNYITNGYGLQRKTIFSVESWINVFLIYSLQVKLKNDEPRNILHQYLKETELEDLSDTWPELSEVQKQQVKSSMQKHILLGTEEAIKKVGL